MRRNVLETRTFLNNYIMRQRLLIIAVCIAALCSSCSEKKDNSPRFYEEIKAVNKLVFAKMTIKKSVTLDDDVFYKVGKRICVFSSEWYMDAYIDLSSLQIDDVQIDDESKTAKVTLPAIQISAPTRSGELKIEYENIGTLRDDLDSKERAKLLEQANQSFKKEVEDNSQFKQVITNQAQRKARKYFESLFSKRGYTVSIDFKE